jgi:Glyoxalase superfamily protein
MAMRTPLNQDTFLGVTMTESKDWARQQAKALKAFLKTNSIEVNQAFCLEAVARMNGAANWQTFAASSDADIVVHEPNALREVAEIALQATLFTKLPEGQTLRSLHTQLSEAVAADEAGEEWQAKKARMNAIWEDVRERDLAVPPMQLPVLIDEALAAVTLALSRQLSAPSNNLALPVMFSRLMQDWRLMEGEEVEVATDRRTYQLKVEDGGYATHTSVAYPHRDPDSLEEGSPQLALGVEINEGLPCVHLYADVYTGEALVSIFAARNGELLVRFGEVPKATHSHPLKDKLGLNDHNAVCLKSA